MMMQVFGVLADRDLKWRLETPKVNTYAGNSFGCTAVVPLGKDIGKGDDTAVLCRLQGAITHFQERVEALLPGAYAWLEPSSYHVTLRAIH